MTTYNTGNPLGSTDPRDLYDNAENLDHAVNSDEDTFQDRMGKSRLTWTGVMKAGSGDPAIAVDAAARAEAAASQVQQDADQIAADAAQQAAAYVVDGVEGQVVRAESASDAAQSAADAAFVNADVYPDVAAGLAAVADGEQFQVLTSGGLEYRRYRKDSEAVATEVGEGFPTPKQVGGKLPIVNSRNLFNKETALLGHVLNTDGVPYEYSEFYVSDFIPVKPATQYSLSVSADNKIHAFYDSDKVFISSIYHPHGFTTPENAAYARISARIAEIPPSTYMMVEGSDLPEIYEPWVGEMAVRYRERDVPNGYAGLGDDGRIPSELLPDDVITLGVDGKIPPSLISYYPSPNLFNKETVTEGYVLSPSTGGLEPNASFYVSDFIPVEAGAEYAHSASTTNKRYTFYDSSKARIQNGLSLSGFTAPVGAAFVRISQRLLEVPPSEYMLVKGSELPSDYMPYGPGAPENQANKNLPNGYAGLDEQGLLPRSVLPDSGGSPWTGKKIVALGDSITYGFIPRNAPGYPGRLNSFLPLVSEELGATFVNYGVSGSTLGDNGTGANQPFSKRYMNMDADADLIIVMGGTNDFRKNVPVGTMSDRTDFSFYGALHVLCEGLIARYYNSPDTTIGASRQIMFMTPIKIIKATDQSLDPAIVPYVEAVKEVCAYYSIPVLDLYNLSGITPHILQTVQGTEPGYTGMYNPYITDGTHPTQEGHEKIARVIAGFVKSLA